MVKNKRGITLIALVITIIVLLILAGVTIAMLTGENGIVKQANQAEKATEEARLREEQELANYENMLKNYQITTDKLKAAMIASEGFDSEKWQGNGFEMKVNDPSKVYYNAEEKCIETLKGGYLQSDQNVVGNIENITIEIVFSNLVDGNR